MKQTLDKYSIAIISLLLTWTGFFFYQEGAKDLGMFIAGGGIAYLRGPQKEGQK